MYLRPVHAETDVATLQAFIKENPLGILTTSLPSPNFPLLQCTHLPWVYDVNEKDGSEEGDLGTIRGHIARNNPHAKALLEAIQSKCGSVPSSTSPSPTLPPAEIETEVMVLFNAPHHSYVTPQFYVETKPSTGKVVPTWDYAAAQIYGQATIYASNEENFILQQVNDLTQQEELRGGKSKGWKVSDAPDRYIDILSKAIIGISIKVTRLEGKYKMSQELSQGDREGVIQGFQAMETDQGKAMAEMVQLRAPA